ncbi:MAG: hypothetical protein L6Q66_14065, partial [Bacteroidia bacterium]|nr:hypothetical protein [Bacteroidia bacterium]
RSNRSSLEMLDGPAEKQPMEFEADLVDLGRMHLNDLSHLFTYMSHACSYSEFIDRYAKSLKTFNVAVYVFKRKEQNG